MAEFCDMKNNKEARPLTDMELTVEDILPFTPELSFILNLLICLTTLLLSILSVFLYM